MREPSYHQAPRAIDMCAPIGAGLRSLSGGLVHLAETAARTHNFTRGGYLFFAPAEPPKPRTHAADRTRSKRWRAGSKRTKKLARLARKHGRRTPFADPWRGWEPLGWIDETS